LGWDVLLANDRHHGREYEVMQEEGQIAATAKASGLRDQALINLSKRSLLLLLLVGGLGLGVLELVHPHFFLYDDNAIYHLPRYEQSYRSWSQDLEPALIDLHQFAGQPHLAVGQSCALYPPAILAMAVAKGIGDERWAIDLLIVFHLLAGAVGMALLLRFLGASERFAWIGGLVWLFLPYPLLISRSWIVMAYAEAHIVWGLLLFFRLLVAPTRGRCVAVALLKTSFIFSGYPQMVLDASLAEGLLLLIAWRSFSWSLGDLLKRLRFAFAAALLTGALSAPLVLPMVKQAAISVRSITYEEFILHALDARMFAWAQVFVFEPDSLFAAETALFYLGLPLFLGLAASLFCLRGLSRGLALLSLVFFLASTELWGLVWGLPMVSMFRWPVKHFLLFVVLAVPPAILALERLALRLPRFTYLLLVPTLLAGPYLAFNREQVTLGPFTLDRRVEELRELPVFAAADQESRFVTFHGSGRDRPQRHGWSPLFLSHNLASLFGVSALGGYEPLASEVSVRASFGAGAFPADATANPALLAHLAANGVGNIVAPPMGSVRKALAVAPGLRFVGNFGEVDLYHLDTVRPIVEVLEGRLTQPPRWGLRTLDFAVEGPAWVRIALSAIPGWEIQIDGQNGGPPALHPDGGFALEVPAGAHQVHLVYEAPGYRLGKLLAATALLLLLVGALFERRKKAATVGEPGEPTSGGLGAGTGTGTGTEVLVACNLCGGEKTRLRFADTRSKSSAPTQWAAFRCTSPDYGIHPPIVECLKCGLVYASPRPTSDVIRQAYAEVEDPLYLEERRGREITFTRHLEAFELKAGAGGGRRLLDVGAYVGVFVECAKNRGWDAVGIEPSAWASGVARQASLEVVQGDLDSAPFLPASFDAVTMWDVIEHLEDPRRTLGQMFELLRPGGWVAVHTMDLGSLFAKVSGKRWPWLMEMHLYFFTRATLRAMLEQVGFEQVEIEAHGRFIRVSYLLTRIAALAPPIGRMLDVLLRRTRAHKWAIPINLGDLVTATARKPETGDRSSIS